MNGTEAQKVLDKLEKLHYKLNKKGKDKHGQPEMDFGMFEHGTEGDNESFRVASDDHPQGASL